MFLCISKDGTYQTKAHRPAVYSLILHLLPFPVFFIPSFPHLPICLRFLPLYCVPPFSSLCFFIPSSLLFFLPITLPLIILFLSTIFHSYFLLFPSPYVLDD